MKTAPILALAAIAALAFPASAPAAPQKGMKDDMKSSMKMDQMLTSSSFMGVEVHQGTVTFSKMNGAGMLTVSKDFMIPKSPAPHWQVVDAKGNTYLLNQFRIAGDKANLSIRLPKYITSVAKVQVWCSFAEVVLGEAKFAKPVMVR